ncbi:LacI family DNA-binding transcriptional regulator [Kocuria koreensis]|uniref:LacI family DNA-binding transcriptional regulator n=2 Tax=Rothia koreensis TaxID=592378 RepID=A0A7M3SW46_9MICC|nr:LacI family DNA-binding transcriptional regulator [Rothia koreensis]
MFMATHSSRSRIPHPTLKDVAALAGVSSGLASMALRGVNGPSENTRRMVLAAAEELQYRGNATASLLAREHPRLLGVTCFLDRDLDADIVDHLYVEAERLGYELVIGATTPSHSLQASLEMLAANSCEAIIAVGPQNPEECLSKISSRIPVLAIGAIPENRQGVSSVHIDDRLAMKLAVDHLVKLGHTDICHVTGGSGYSSSERKTGYEIAMRGAGLDKEIRIIEGGQTEEAGVEAAQVFLLGSAPTAVIAYNDACAIGAMTEARKLGYSVPDDLSVVGCDDSRASRIAYIDLTTVSQDREDLACQALRRTLTLIKDPNSTRTEYKSAPQLIHRSTTGPQHNRGKQPNSCASRE